MIKNLGPTLDSLKPKLREYLLKRGTKFQGRLFTCPNKTVHRHQDLKPACNFLDQQQTQFYCYACGEKGDILNACNMLENKPITGYGFHETVEYLCKLLKVPFELSRETSEVESVFINDIEKFLGTLVEKSHENLVNLMKNEPENPVVKFLKVKGWDKSIEEYQLGVVSSITEAKSQKVKDMLNFLNLNLNDLVNNVVIPITFHQRIIGFQIRITDEKNPVKYKTYLTTTKGLFNLDKIDPTQPTYIVEGASSAIVLHQVGIDNVVATLGNSFNENHYEALVGRGCKKITLWFDNDDGGDIGKKKAAEMCVNRHDMDISFMILSEENDPADYVLAKKKIEDLPCLSLWDFLVRLNHRELLLKYTASQGDLIQKEQLVNSLAGILKVTKTVLLEELQKYETGSISTLDTLREKESLVESINTFEQWAWSRGTLLGLSSFKSFDKEFDGLQEGLILVGGAPNVGKSHLCVSLVTQIINNNPDVYIVYFSVDDSSLITMSRFLANLSGIPINTVSNPKYRIVENVYLKEDERKDLMVRREKALDYLRKNVTMFNLKDSANGYTIEYVENLMKSLAPLIHGKKLVVFIDNLHKLKSEKAYKSDRGLVELICGTLKVMSGRYRCPIICTVEHTKAAIAEGNMGGSAIKETSSLHYDANLILTVAVKQTIGSTKMIDLVVGKNKMSTFIGILPFVLYPELARMQEADGQVFE